MKRKTNLKEVTELGTNTTTRLCQIYRFYSIKAFFMNGGNDTKAQSIIILQKRPYKTESGTYNKINDRHEILSQQYE